MAEYISKEDALYAIEESKEDCITLDNAEAWWACINLKKAIRENIENISPITGFEKHGQWLPDGDKVFCSECGFSVSGEYVPKVFIYCPRCGAKMDKE